MTTMRDTTTMAAAAERLRAMASPTANERALHDASVQAIKQARADRVAARARARASAATAANKTGGEATRPLRRQVVASAFAALGEGAANPSAEDAWAQHAQEKTMQEKKKLKLLKKVEGGRTTASVMSSAPVGAAAIGNAPKLSDFRGDRVAHSVAMRAWCAENLSKKTIEKETRVRPRGRARATMPTGSVKKLC